MKGEPGAIRKLDLLCTGTGRCATGFYSMLLSSAGVPCGHEKFFTPYGYDLAVDRLGRYGKDGVIPAGKNHKAKYLRLRAESSWCAAPWLNEEALKDVFVVHLIRHPKDTIESWMRWATEQAPAYWEYAASYCPRMDELEYPVDKYAHRYIEWNRMIERKLEGRPFLRWEIRGNPMDFIGTLTALRVIRPNNTRSLYSNTHHNKHGNYEVNFDLSLIHDEQIRQDLEEIAEDYGFKWESTKFQIASPIVKAVITTLNNEDVLHRQIDVLRQEPLSEIVVVNNGSTDGTAAWLCEQRDLTVVHRENMGAGPGRNAGLDRAGEFDRVLMLDGGILPAHNTVERMLEYLDPRPGIAGIGVEVDDLVTDATRAWRIWGEHITRTYWNRCLSHTAYGMFRREAWDGYRFCEEGPFGMAGWGADDNEMAYQWLAGGLRIHVVTCGHRLPYYKGKHVGGSIHAFRRAGGSWSKIKRETGLEPWSEGSVYEQRVLWLQHNWPQFDLGEQRDEPWMTLGIKAGDTVEGTAALINKSHGLLYKQKLLRPREGLPRPYSLILDLSEAKDEIIEWAEPRHLRRWYGTIITVDGKIIRKNDRNKDKWAGDFRLSYEDDWTKSLRPHAHYYGYAETLEDIGFLVQKYTRLHPTMRCELKLRPNRKHVELRV